MHLFRPIRFCLAVFICGGGSVSGWGQAQQAVSRTEPARRSLLTIPRIERAPTLEDFPNLQAASALATTMRHVDGFLQRIPNDHAPVTQQTDAYLGYDQLNLYIVFLCHDDHPELIRSQLTKRENANDDDQVQIVLDTYKDQRRG